jgi:hypothetical protein
VPIPTRKSQGPRSAIRPLTAAQVKRAAIRVKARISGFENPHKRRVAAHLILVLIEHALIDRPEAPNPKLAKLLSAMSKAANRIIELLGDNQLRLQASLTLADMLNRIAGQHRDRGLGEAYPSAHDAERYLTSIEWHNRLLAHVASIAGMNRPPSSRGRRRQPHKQLIIVAAADIFEYLTGESASRKIRGEDHAERGKPYGEFWAFASALWMELFGSVSGLDDVMANWVRHRASEDRLPNALMVIVDLLNPEWGILPPRERRSPHTLSGSDNRKRR